MSDTARTVLKEVPNARWYSDGTILLKNCRASYPFVFEAQPNKGDDGKTYYTYSIVALMPKETHDAAKKLCIEFINKILKENNGGEKLASKLKFIKDGDPKDEDDVGKPENAGNWVVATRERKRPRVVSNRKDPDTGKLRQLKHDDEDDVAMIYGGCYVNVLIRPWWQNSKQYGKRVNAGVTLVQFVRDGERFGSGGITEDDVDETLDEEGTDEDDDDDGADL